MSFAGKTRRAQMCSYYLIQNINYWGHIGGFQAQLDRLRCLDAPLSLQGLLRIVQPIAEIRQLLNEEFLLTFVPSLQQAFAEHVLALPDDTLKGLTRQALNRPMAYIGALMERVFSQSDIRRLSEQFALSVALRLLRCPFINKRIQGVNDIKEYIDIAQKKEEFNAKQRSAFSRISSIVAGTGAPPPAARFWVSTDFLARWLLDNGVLEELLHPDSSHTELIRRSYEPMRLLLSKGLLNEKHLDLLWSFACLGKHESVEHLVYELAGRLSAYLPASLLVHLFRRICDKPFSDYDVQLVQLVKEVTLSAFKTIGLPSETAAVAVAGVSGNNGGDSAATPGGEPPSVSSTPVGGALLGLHLLWTLWQTAQQQREQRQQQQLLLQQQATELEGKREGLREIWFVSTRF